MQCPSCHSEVGSDSRYCSSCGAPVSPDVMPTMTFPEGSLASHPRSSVEGRFPIGAVIGDRYRILRVLGRGGMGEVYHAHDSKLDQEVALKFLPESAREPSQLERFRAEVRIARQVSHPNVCRVYDMGEADGSPFISMEYVDGEDLRSLLRRIGRLPPDKAVEIARRLCAGLAAAHAVRVLHRDLKPANIMIDGYGGIHIMDFGLADLAGKIAGSDVRSGTPAYMAPEQAEGREVTVRSDLYALGLVLFEVFTGQKPWIDGGDRSELPSASRTTADVDPAVEKVIRRCLEPDPPRRPASALDVARALPGGDPLAEALAAGETPSPEAVAASEEAGALSVRASVACLGVILASLVAVFALDSRSHILTLLPTPDSAGALAADARALAERMGYGDGITDDGYGFEYVRELESWTAESGIAVTELREIVARGGPSPVTFWYRQSPVTLIPANPFISLLGPEDPPTQAPGMVTIRTDLGGRLLMFLAVPEGPDRSTPPSLSFDDLLEAAGFDPVRDCAAATPAFVRPVASTDSRTAWTCMYPAAPELDVHVEAASWAGNPVYFEVIGPWEGPAPAGGFVGAFFLTILIGAGLLARGNYRRGRGDRQGALRLAAFGLLLVLVFSLTLSHGLGASAGDPPVTKLIQPVGVALYLGTILWVLYVALEPYVRRRWPQSLISWRRLLSGRWRDAVVGGHVLAGVAAGMAVSALGSLLDPRFSLLPTTPGSEFALSGVGPTIGVAAQIVFVATLLALLYFLAYFLLLVLFRRTWLVAAVALTIVVGLILGDPAVGSLPLLYAIIFGGLTVGLGVFVVSRFGVLSLAVSFVVNWMERAAPMVPDYSTWYAQVTIVALVIILGLTAWSFHAALGGRRLLREDFLES